MTETAWHEHASECRRVAAMMSDAAARRILLEAADDYEQMGRRERAAETIAFRAATMQHRPDPVGASIRPDRATLHANATPGFGHSGNRLQL